MGAIIMAEKAARELTKRWVRWLRTESAERPAAFRVDYLVQHTGAGTAALWTGELVENGFSIMGWEDGPEEVFNAVIDQCYRDTACGQDGCLCGSAAPGDSEDEKPTPAGKRQKL
eukprot:NODE_2127_length_507_cov_391.657205_g1737_i0.p1 GENE.NODE_2127_length_507_cov_391.657205_g1737_i0~~NODE_2127_length_507_cov_391.657205_g1737_i0.p1  ORF type:complete len:123 (+),score=38.05 NODE_2127_length_507_cov_391.657205_g1737_i0:26-370(+)